MIQKHIFHTLLLGVILIAAGCGSSHIQSSTTTSATETATLTFTPTPTLYPTPDLSARPLVWFAPLPPLPVRPGRQFIGAEDYMELFLPDAPWQTAQGHIDVFELYGETMLYPAGTGKPYAEWQEETARLIEFVNQNGLALAMEHSPIERPADCGTDAESWGGLSVNLEIARIIQRLGGKLHFVAMDAPYYYTSLVDYDGTCQWSAERVAREIDSYIQSMESVFPDIVIGDTEPLQADMDTAVYKEWMVTFRETTGYNLPFFHMDIDYARPDWAERVGELENYAREQRIEFGILYFGNWDDLSDEAWLSNAGERVKRYELAVGGQPDHVLFQSWHDHPDYTLPETEPYTYTSFITQYFDNKSGLGFRREGPGRTSLLEKRCELHAPSPTGRPETLWMAILARFGARVTFPRIGSRSTWASLTPSARSVCGSIRDN